MFSEKKRLLVLLGPTAVGKSAAGVRIAEAVGAEIINCDSMQVYRGFDIGTDTISEDKREGIPHHLLNIVEPDAQFTAADFVRHAVGAINTIRSAGKLPLVTGGTGLYLQALIDGLFPEKVKDPSLRRSL
ncbi:MAG: tRNA (adenosine(37)-N6)-dimethylallyltransferase MiaA, partial [Candidatus Aminicenantes bacterium]|nr:tRNA (adenosine(37)-N6)-dimethylallyltransferase MiaA [Candidatus Aminicenantes bacterium]